MADEEYTMHLEAAVKTLHRLETEVFTAMMELVSASGLDKKFPLQQHQSNDQDLQQIEEIADTNLKYLAKLIKHISDIKHRLIHDNDLQLQLDDE